MCRECKEHKEFKDYKMPYIANGDKMYYNSFEELTDDLKNKFKGREIKRSKDAYVDFINKLNENSDKLLSDYVNNYTKVRIYYSKCDHEHQEGEGVIPSSYKSGTGCGICCGLIVVKDINDLTTTNLQLAKEWHPTKNGDLKPTQFSSGSNKKVWWLGKCGHEWEAVIANRARRSDACPYCSNHKVLRGYNDIATTHPQYIKYFVNIEDAYTHTYASNDKVEMRCPICGVIKVMSINDLIFYGFSCPKCSDGISYPNKVMALVVEALGLNYELEYTVEGYSQYRYDIYLQDYKKAIENDGKQHYDYLDDKLKNKKAWNDKTGMEIHYIDLGKESVLMNEGLELIIVDCKESNIDYIRNGVENHPFFQQFDLSNINWKEIDIQAQKSKKIEVCKYWKEQKEINKDFTTTMIAEIFKTTRKTIIDWLNWGNESGLCIYNGKEEDKASKRRKSKFVYLIKQDGTKEYEEAMSQNKLSRLTGICVNTIGRRREDGKPLNGYNAKYGSKYIGCYIVDADEWDSQHN